MSTRYINIKSFKLGSTTYTTLQNVTVNEQAKRITDSGDNDTRVSFQARGVADTVVRAELRDPVQARALIAAASATMEFIGVPESGGTEVKVTVLNTEFFSHNMNAQHNNVHNQSLDGGAMSADGVTSPVSVAPVTP